MARKRLTKEVGNFEKTDLWLLTLSGLDDQHGRRWDLLVELERVIRRLATWVAEDIAEDGDTEWLIEEEGHEGALTMMVRLASVRDRLAAEFCVADEFSTVIPLNPHEFINECRAKLTCAFAEWLKQRDSARTRGQRRHDGGEA